MVRVRNSDGTWRDAKDPSISCWAQGSDCDRETYFRNITRFVPHDVPGLANFMGGNAKLEAYLAYFFDNDFYYVGDEYPPTSIISSARRGKHRGSSAGCSTTTSRTTPEGCPGTTTVNRCPRGTSWAPWNSIPYATGFRPARSGVPSSTGWTLVVRIGSRPNRKWGAAKEDILPSVSAPTVR